MKYFAIIFSLYVAMLALMPCQDAEDVSMSTHAVSLFSKPVKALDHCGKEICSPLCSCACCSVSRDFIQHTNHVAVVNILNVPYCEYKTPAIAEQLIEIDQPPQIV